MAETDRVCASCGCDLSDYAGVGYEEPAFKDDRDRDSCDPFVAWLILCRKCYDSQQNSA